MTNLKEDLLNECEIFSSGIDDSTTLSQIKEEIETMISSLHMYLSDLNRMEGAKE